MFLLALGLCAVPLVQEPTPDATVLTSEITEVTVFSGAGALVMRRAELLRGQGSFVIPGLPWSADPDSVRVRAMGTTVVGVEVRDRHVAAVAGQRLATLRETLRGLVRDQQALSDERVVLQSIGAHLDRLLQVEAVQHNEEVGKGRADVATWGNNLRFLREQLSENRTEMRELGWRSEELDRQKRDLEEQLGSIESVRVNQREVHVQLEGGSANATLEIEYRVSSAGWRPTYDLRTAPDARSVDLAYRAQVWQKTGEDWTDCSLALSTAQPQVGAQGPDPIPVWLGLHDPEADAFARRRPAAEAPAAALRELGYAGGESANTAAAFASVENQGLSVRFRIPRRETILSQEAPATVLVGQTRLDVQPEYFATPALGDNVWLRGRARNSSEWVLLQGRAAVYFGADFIGHAALEMVQPGADFTLHLGPDPALTIERKQVEDKSKKPGLFSSRTTHIERWRVDIENHGAAAVGPDGSARVFVREVIPRSKDSRLKIELQKTTPKTTEDERWKRDREEEGILTWLLVVPAGGQASIIWETKMSYPEGSRVVR